MNRADFMKELAGLLADVSPTEREEAIQYYNDYFDDAGEENEQSVIAALGSPGQLAKTIKNGLADGGNVGEFTEKGFSGYETQINDEIMDLNNPDGIGKDNNFTQGGQTSNGYRNMSQNGNETWQAADSAQGSNTGSGWQQGEQSRSGAGEYSGGNNYSGYQNGNNYSGYQNGNNYRNTSQTEEKKRMSGGMIALIVVLCILASPFLLGIGGGILGIIVGIFGTLFGLVVGIGAAAIAMLVVGVCLFVYGIVLIFGIPLGGLALMGVGMICAAIGLLFLWFTVMICGLLIPAIIRGIVKLFNSIFHRGGATA